MSKVIEFPTSERKAVTILQQLESGAEDLEELYQVLDDLHRQLHDTEESAELVEATYNKNMREYVKHVPIAEVPVKSIEAPNRVPFETSKPVILSCAVTSESPASTVNATVDVTIAAAVPT